VNAPAEVVAKAGTIGITGDYPPQHEAYEAFDRREPGWTKVALELGG
jgi:hypothetical protein